MKVIFLDFNGVLDTSYKIDEVNYDNLQRLKYIVHETEANVVISSSIKNSFLLTNRMNSTLRALLDRLMCEGINVLGFTPYGYSREEEIKMYLEAHPEIDSFVVIDDDYDMDFGESMIKLPSQRIHGQLGLDDISVNKAIKVLGKVEQSVKLKKTK